MNQIGVPVDTLDDLGGCVWSMLVVGQGVDIGCEAGR